MDVDEAKRVLDEHGYRFGLSHTREIRDPIKRAAIKAACLVLRRAGEPPVGPASVVVRPSKKGG